MSSTSRTRRRWRFALAFGAFFVALWLLWDTPVVYPVKLFVVLVHEISHGLVAVATGGEIREIAVTADQGGYCVCPGGDAFLTLSAGYLGSLGWGAFFALLAGRGQRLGRSVLVAAGAGILILTLLYIRRPFALLLGLGSGAALAWAGTKLRAAGVQALLLGLGLTSCLYALLDVKSDVLDRPGTTSDATLLADVTGIPGFLWGLLWIGISLGVVVWLVRHHWRRA